MSEPVTPAALARLEGAAASQQESATTQLALTPYEYGNMPITPTKGPSAQDAHPSAARLASSQWAGKTGALNRAQAAEDHAPVWVTVPVDKVITSGGGAAVAPLYATPSGYRARPGESTGSIPPAIPAGHPY